MRVRRLAGLLVPLALCSLVACSPDPEAEADPVRPSDSGPAPLTDAQIARNNEGVALMAQYRNEPARVIFAALREERPGWTDVRVNEAIATLNRQNEGDERRALAIVKDVLERDPEHVRANYMAGLIHFYLGEAEPALAYLRRVRAWAPDDAYLAYFTGQALDQLGRQDEALGAYERAIALDPYLRSAYYGAALAQRRLGDAAAARALLDAYRRFENNPRARLAEFKYTRKGPLAEAVAVDRDDAAMPAPTPTGAIFLPPEPVAAWPGEPAAPSLTTADIDGDGAQDLLLTDADGPARVLLQQADGGFRDAPAHGLAGAAALRAAAWGIPDVSDQPAVLLCGDGAIDLRQRGAGGWAPAPGIEAFTGLDGCRDVTALDADHDGDLDWLTVFHDAPATLFSNNLDGSYRRLDEPLGDLLAGGGRPARQILSADLDGDRDVDFVVLHDQPPHRMVLNDRLWSWRGADNASAFESAPLTALTAADLGADGRIDLLALNETGALQRWRRDAADRWVGDELLAAVTRTPRSAELLAQDFTGDGRADLLVHDGSGFRVYVEVDDGWRETFRADASLLALQPVLLDPAAGPALAGVVRDGPGVELRLWGAGPGRHSFLALDPVGRADAGAGVRSNPSGIGTGVALRVADRWTLAERYDRGSAPGMSLQPMAIGLGGAPRADYVRLYWTDGVLQTELALDAGETHRVAENQRQLASCPVLFAWNGERHEFVSDVLGVGGIGFWQGPDRYSTPRPWEYFEFPENAIAPRDGRYEVKIGEPMQEIAYLDHARLQVYDLAPGWGLTLNERMHTGGGPAPDGRPWFYRESTLRLPVEARNDRGETVTADLAAVDGRAAPPGVRDPRFLGRLARDHVLTLRFDAPINVPIGVATDTSTDASGERPVASFARGAEARGSGGSARPVLVAHGWVEYPYSQTVFAAWQADADYRPPTLEAYADGRWRTVYEAFGYPAGMPREMALPLDALPARTTALRLTANWEIYWDRIAIVYAETPPTGKVTVSEALPASARLALTGFARRDTLAQHRPYYDYSDRSPFWDTEYASGHYTALGPVEPLVAATDDAFALIGPGEELHLEFDAPPRPADRRRIVVLEVRGYAKDMDLYTATGDTVEPFPRTPGIDASARETLHPRYLTRWKDGY